MADTVPAPPATGVPVRARPTGRPCLVCNHPERAEIDKLLVIAGHSLKPISDRFGIPTRPLGNHRDNHIPTPAMAAGTHAVEAAEGARGIDLRASADELRGKAMGLLAKAEASGDLRTALQGVAGSRAVPGIDGPAGRRD
jgi:hypothetical protein